MQAYNTMEQTMYYIKPCMRFLCKFRNYYETEKENKAFFIILLIFTEQKEKKEPTSIYSTKNYNTKRKHTLPYGSFFFADGGETICTNRANHKGHVQEEDKKNLHASLRARKRIV